MVRGLRSTERINGFLTVVGARVSTCARQSILLGISGCGADPKQGMRVLRAPDALS
ncbi:hypothetical protein BDI4_1620002 [Burkholderia diffusa]|nr:hypothetical protein BDI4_1620002 [Burkholderia diffusa]